jgi:hypothetical protein
MAAILLVCAGRLAALPQLSGPGAPARGDPEAGRMQVRFAFCTRPEFARLIRVVAVANCWASVWCS